jgi:membrane-bound ClpP family serine protease
MDNEVRAKFNSLSRQLLKEKVTTSERKERLYQFAKENNVEVTDLRKLVNTRANWTIALGLFLMAIGVFLFVLQVSANRLGFTGVIGLVSGGTMIYQASQIRKIIPSNMNLLDD